jgi:hypothetical protein
MTTLEFLMKRSASIRRSYEPIRRKTTNQYFLLLCIETLLTLALHPLIRTHGRRRKRRTGPSGIQCIPTVVPNSKCKLRMMKLERIKDYLLMEQEFIRNHEVFKLREERDQEEHEKLEELCGSPMGAGMPEELINDNHAIVRSSMGPEYYVNILSSVNQDLLTVALLTRSQFRIARFAHLSSHPDRRCFGSAKCFSMNQNEKKTNTKNGPIITLRPYKSYLKVMMNEVVFETLHSSTQQIISSWEDAQSTINPEERPKLKIKSRSLQSLHMTYFFIGTILEEMHPQEETLWYIMLKQKLCNQDVGKKYALKFRGFETFPPQRLNLTVASFESSED